MSDKLLAKRHDIGAQFTQSIPHSRNATVRVK